MTMNTSSSLADLATEYPGSWRILHQYQLDFCCGGAQSLEEACGNCGLDAKKVLGEIVNEAGKDAAVRWDQSTPDQLIDHILTAYHEPLRAELPRLIELAAQVEEVHADKESCPRGLTDHLNLIRQAVESHLWKEENILFPMIRSGNHAVTAAPIQVMRMEHDEHGENLRRTRALKPTK